MNSQYNHSVMNMGADKHYYVNFDIIVELPSQGRGHVD